MTEIQDDEEPILPKKGVSLHISEETQAELIAKVMTILSVSQDQASKIVDKAKELYSDRMKKRFSELKVRERLKRTNPFLVKIRGVKTVKEWADYQVKSALFASEEEAVGHLLEAIAKICHPGASVPHLPDDFDYEIVERNAVTAYQVKMSWDCMPMSTRKNLSNTISILKQHYQQEGKLFVGVFAPCYGKAKTTNPKGQQYTSMRSREFWSKVGSGDQDYDAKVGEVVGLLCAEFRSDVQESLVPELIQRLAEIANEIIGEKDGSLNYLKLFRSVNI
ncbi:hypothetical protein A6A40_25065 (plasmid) [Azospirillum humicireducens]|uniref:Type II restriction endonuclease EcoO109IR domain-containing protein n=1 Tax=Azospirillum humicireducens TaxID=1226968 RepID=A0A2R4VV56_9PROT|nr:PmeII family type II restriction endonuclease [Azospirillum humicireducens]AWB08313.1 hypothetical protein A6A40_25065 [Azospirillum humicireducens]